MSAGGGKIGEGGWGGVGKIEVVVGFDGFVDEILAVAEKQHRGMQREVQRKRASEGEAVRENNDKTPA